MRYSSGVQHRAAADLGGLSRTRDLKPEWQVASEFDPYPWMGMQKLREVRLRGTALPVRPSRWGRRVENMTRVCESVGRCAKFVRIPALDIALVLVTALRGRVCKNRASRLCQRGADSKHTQIGQLCAEFRLLCRSAAAEPIGG